MNARFRDVSSLAFRPFFLAVGGHVVAVVLAWGLYRAGGIDWPGNLPPRFRHGHEMLFGFGGGAVAGFLLTVVATWTGRPLRASPAMAAAFLVINVGAAIRVLAPVGSAWMSLAVGLWLAAYGLFLIRYTPILLPRRLDM